MKRAILAATAVGCGLMLSACDKAQAPAPAAEGATTGPNGLTPAEQIREAEEKKDAAEPSKTEQPKMAAALGAVQRFKALGTEPFWNFDIDGSTAKYVTPENEAGTSFDVARTDSAQGVAFAGAMNGKRVTILITPESCSDGMSDRTHAYTVKAMIDGKPLNGCANPG